MMKWLAPFAFASMLALAACGDSNQDKLSDDLATAEQGAALDRDAGDNYAEDVNLAAAAAAPRPAPPVVNDIAAGSDDRDDPLSPLADAAPPPPAPVPVQSPSPVNPSFDCALATTDVEEWICDQPDLAAIDRTMARNYRRALGRIDPARASILRRTGEAFLRDRNRCPDPDCVMQAYRWRLREIAEISGP